MRDDLKELKGIVGDIRRMKRQESMGRAMDKMLRIFGNALPKKIVHPDSLVRNIHLYKPGMGRRKTILK